MTAITLEASHTTVLKLLARGRAPDWVADATGRTPAAVREIGQKYGWPDKDKMLAALAAAGESDVARIPAAPPSPARPSDPGTTGLDGGATQHPDPGQPSPPAGRLELMLARCAKHDTAAVRTARNSVLSACTRLEQALQNAETRDRDKQHRDAEKAAAKARIDSLKRQLREAQQQLRGDRPTHPKREPRPG
jgi:hypothetical protein